MATPERRAYPSLEGLLFEKGYQFEFYQAVRLALRLYSGKAVGGFLQPSREAVRFHLHSSLISPPATIRNIAREPLRKSRNSKPAEMVHITTAALGLTGFSGVMPLIYTDLLLEASSQRNPAIIEFLDMFNHRLISLQYRAWEKRRLHIPFERETVLPIEQRTLSSYLFSLMGIGTPSLVRRLEVSDHHLLRHAGLLSSARRSVSALRSLLTSFLRISVEIRQFRGMWCSLSPAEMLVLRGKNDSTQLGMGALIGRSTWYPQASFKVQLGPISFVNFLDFLPGSKSFGDVIELTNHFTEAKFEEFQIEFMLRAKEVPDCQLAPHEGVPPRLGWTSWLKADRSREPLETFRTVVFRSREPIATARRKALAILKRIEGEAERIYKIKVVWSEAAVSSIMTGLDGSQASRRDSITAKLNQSIESQVKSGGFTATKGWIEVHSGELRCRVA